MKILIVEDEAELSQMCQEYLSTEGYVCEVAADFLEAEDKLNIYEYDVLLLDIGLPDGNGLDLITQVKSKTPSTGILILSAKNALDDKVHGLNLGADDYLTKPFHLSELNARIQSIIRRRQLGGKNIVSFHELELDIVAKELKVNDQQVDLTRKEYDLILYFISNENRVLTKAAIAEHLWGDYMDLADNFDLIYSHVKNLRKKIVQKGGNDYVKTIYGMGYKFTAR